MERNDAIRFGAFYVGSGLSILGTTTAVSYHLDPLRFIKQTSWFQYPYVQNTYDKIGNWKWITNVTNKICNHPKKMNKALVESLLITNLGTPIFMPLQLGMAYYLTDYFKSITKKESDKNTSY
jgi:ABC-type phosphate transport system permease subunit